MKNYIYFLFIVFWSFLFIACEQAIDLELPEYEDDVVLYGVLIAGEQPKILLTESTGYFEPLNNWDRVKVLPSAKVKLSDGSKEYSLTYQPWLIQVSYPVFTVNNGTNVTTSLLGGYTNSDLIIEEEKTYTIEVTYKERTIKGQTTVPRKVALNKASHEVEFFEDPFSPNLFCWQDKIEVNFDDPLGENFYELDWKIEEWTYDDCGTNIISGDTIELDSCRGSSKNKHIPIFNDEAFDNTRYTYLLPQIYSRCSSFMPDTLVESSNFSIYRFVLQTVSKELYDFSNSLEMQQAAEGNPFQEPTTIKSTVEGGIGVFASKSAPSDTIVLRAKKIL